MKKVFFSLMILLTAVFSVQAQNSRKANLRPSGVEKPTDVQPNIHREVSCDTLRFPVPGVVTYYILGGNDAGYVTGNNSYGDKAKAEYFEAVEDGYAITGFVAEFAIAKSLTNSEADITFGIWDNTGANGKPGSMKASATYPLKWIIEDIDENWLTAVNLTESYTPTGPFYVGIVLPQTTGDTVALWCRESLETYNGTAWDMWENNTWHAFSEESSWKLNTSMLIHPIVCKTLGINKPAAFEISIVPNPSNGMLNIQTWQNATKITVEVYAYNGSRVYTYAVVDNDKSIELDLTFLPKGIYVIKLYDDFHQHSQKIILN